MFKFRKRYLMSPVFSDVGENGLSLIKSFDSLGFNM